jgi:hypothetical protein
VSGRRHTPEPFTVLSLRLLTGLVRKECNALTTTEIARIIDWRIFGGTLQRVITLTESDTVGAAKARQIAKPN